MNQGGPRGNRASAESPHRQAMPPGFGFSKRADCHTGKAASPVIVDIRPKLVTGEPVDFIFFDAVKDHFVAERNAVGGTSVGALAADLAKVFNPDVNRLVRHEWEIRQ